MANYTTSVKQFAAPLLQERTVDLSFGWKTSVANSTHKTSTELRDSKGNLVFAIAETSAALTAELARLVRPARAEQC